MWGSQTFQWIRGTPHHIGELKTTELDLSAADADEGIIPIGKHMNYKAGSQTLMEFGQGFAIGVLTARVNLGGSTDLTAFKQRAIGDQDIPIKRGQAVSLRAILQGCEAELEAADDAEGIIDHLFATTGDGAITAATPRYTALSCINGALYVAQAGDFVIAHMIDAGLTPKADETNIRIHVMYCSPYLLPSDYSPPT